MATPRDDEMKKHRPDETSRLARIWRQWTATRMILQRMFRGQRLDNADCALLSAAAIFLFLLQVESLLWARLELPTVSPLERADGPDPVRDLLWQDPLEGFWIFPFGGLTTAQTGGFGLVVVAACVINAWLLDRWLSRLTSRDIAIRGGLLGLRRLLLGVPWLGLAVFPVWQAVLNALPPWALKKPSASMFELEARRRFGLPAAWRRGFEWLSSSPTVLVLWLIPVNMFAIRMGLAWLNVPERTGDSALLLIGLVFTGLHYAGFVCMVFYFDLRARERQLPTLKAIALGALCFAWLLPMPLPLLSFFIFIQLEEPRIKTMIHSTHEDGPYPPPLRGAMGIDRPWLIRVLFGFSDTTEDSVTHYQLLKLYRTKTFLLILDAGTFMLSILWLEQFLPSLWLQLPLAILLILPLAWVVASGLVAGVACTVAFVGRFVRSSRWRAEQDRHPVKRYRLLASLALLSGARLANTGADPQALATGLLHVGTLAFIFSLFYLLPAVGRYLFANRGRDIGLFLWPIVFQTMAQFGYLCQNDPQAAALLSRAWRLLQALTPLWALLLFVWRGRWLARPFRWRDAFDPRQPRPIRRRLALMLVTAALLLGGLAISFWIRARRDLESLAATAGAAGPGNESLAEGAVGSLPPGKLAD